VELNPDPDHASKGHLLEADSGSIDLNRGKFNQSEERKEDKKTGALLSKIGEGK